jgi:hypothetical protein
MPVRLPKQGWIALALLVAGAALVFWREHRSATPAQELARQPVEPAPSSAAPPVATKNVVMEARAEVCAGEKLAVSERGRGSQFCVEAVDVDQNGSVRSYRAVLGKSTSRSLRIDAIGSRVLAAAIEGAGSTDLRCSEAACAGIRIGVRDVEGARLIHLERVKLQPQFSVGSAVDGGVEINGQLRTPPEDRLAGLACTDQGVTIVTSESASTSFCPHGGAGFELASDGTKSYKFTNLDGESIRVAVDEAERVRRVEYQADATLVCRSPACASVRISQPGSSGERTFTFFGTTLTEVSRAESNAVMSGTLILPPL